MRSWKGRQGANRRRMRFASRMMCGGQRECQWLGNWGLSQVGGESIKTPFGVWGSASNSCAAAESTQQRAGQAAPPTGTAHHVGGQLIRLARSRRYGAEDKVTTPQQSPPTPCKGWGIVSLSGSGHDQGLIRDPFLQVFYGFIARKPKVLLQKAVAGDP